MSRRLLSIVSLWAALIMCAGCAAADRVTVNPQNLVYLPLDLEVELALAAGPEHIRSEATVYIFNKHGYERVHSGTNGMTCLVNRDGHQKGGREFRPTCWDAEGSATIVPVMLRVGELIAQGSTAKEIEDDIDLGFESGRYKSPRKAGIAYMLKGDVTFDDKTQKISETVFPSHYMIYAPGVSNADIGMTEEAFKDNSSLPVIYDGYSGGSRMAYIIIMASDNAAHTHQ